MWSNIYVEGLQIRIFFKNIVFLSLNIVFVKAIGAHPYEMSHYVAFHLHCLHNVAFHQGLHCLPKDKYRYPVYNTYG